MSRPDSLSNSILPKKYYVFLTYITKIYLGHIITLTNCYKKLYNIYDNDIEGV